MLYRERKASALYPHYSPMHLYNHIADALWPGMVINKYSQKGNWLVSKKRIVRLYIKNMVSIRCKMVVKSELDKLGLTYTSVELGVADIKENISDDQ